MKFALYVTIAPAWFDPGEAQPGFFTPFWMLVALHDALVRPMPGKQHGARLAESWTESPDKLSYEFKLRQGLKFHNGDPFTVRGCRIQLQPREGRAAAREGEGGRRGRSATRCALSCTSRGPIS